MWVTVWNFGLILKSDRLKFSCPEMTAEHNRKKKESSSFMAKTQPMKNHEICLLWAVKVFSFLCCAGTCTHGWRLQNTILCWSQINSSLPEKYLAVCFKSSPCITLLREDMMKDPGEHPDERRRARHMGKGWELPCPLWAPLSQYFHVFTSL